MNSVYGRLGSAKQIYDYTNNRSQENINTMLLNEIFSFDLGLEVFSLHEGVSTESNIAEFEGKEINTRVYWNIQRKHNLEFEFSKETCPDGVILSTDRADVTLSQPQDRYASFGNTLMKVNKGITSVTMTVSISDFTVSETKKFYLLPPVYYGFSQKETITNPSVDFSDKIVSIDASGQYRLTNGELDAYFYICIPRCLGTENIHVTSSGFRVPFEKVETENSSSTGLDYYDCWRNPTGSMVLAGKEVIYDVIKLESD